MARVQVITKEGSNLYAELRKAIESNKIRSFEKVKVKGGLKIKHVGKDTPGWINLEKQSGIILAEVKCNAPDKEWKILQAFIGRMTDHFHDDIVCINVQF
jgi:hypothetical protein